MSLAAGPGRGGSSGAQLPDELELVIDKHVAYIQSLDTVSTARFFAPSFFSFLKTPRRQKGEVQKG